jgi:hypothetical protein
LTVDAATAPISDAKLDYLDHLTTKLRHTPLSRDEWAQIRVRIKAAEDALETIDCHATIDMKPEVRAAIDKWREGRKGGRVEGKETGNG